MFDDLETAEQKSECEQQSSDGDGIPRDRWAHFPALIVFGVLIVPFHRYRWGWQLAICAAYTVYVFWFALAYGSIDMDDLLGDSRVVRYIAPLLIPHVIILGLIVWGVTEWIRLNSILPGWATHGGRRPPLWLYCGFLLLTGAGIWQGFWMGKKIKKRFKESEESVGEN
jgi:hypothetical protein